MKTLKDETKHRAQNAIPTVGGIPMFKPSRIEMDVDAGQILSLAKYIHQLQILVLEHTAGSRKRSVFLHEINVVSEFIKKQRIVDFGFDYKKSLYDKRK